MRKFGITVRTWDEGGFVLEAKDREAAEACLSRMERDDVEGHAEFKDGGYEAFIDGEVAREERADVSESEYPDEEDAEPEPAPGLVPSKGDRCKCQDCGWEGDASDCLPISDLHERVAPGEPMPAGECPDCGALCQLL